MTQESPSSHVTIFLTYSSIETWLNPATSVITLATGLDGKRPVIMYQLSGGGGFGGSWGGIFWLSGGPQSSLIEYKEGNNKKIICQ